MTSPILVSVQVGLPRTIAQEGERPWTSGIYKEPVTGPVWLGKYNLAGDGQAEQRIHGGPERALLGYSASHYPLWRHEVPAGDFSPGAFGENFTIDGLDESVVCIGDTYAVGSTLVQVSEPRQPCIKLARRCGVPDMVARVRASGRTGWYMRVLQEGMVERGLPVILVERPHPRLTMDLVHALIVAPEGKGDVLRELAACPRLSTEWREKFAAKAEG